LRIFATGRGRPTDDHQKSIQNGRLIPMDVETAQKNFSLESKAQDFDGMTIGFSALGKNHARSIA